MTTQLDLSKVIRVSEESPTDVFFVFGKLVEEVGELAKALNQPERCDEPDVGEMADVIITVIDLYQKMYGPNLNTLHTHLDKKTLKWANITGVKL